MEEKRKVILCVGDSLGMPRKNVPFKNTWFYRLSISVNKYLFVNNFKRALTTEGLRTSDALEIYNPIMVILHVGIVDCAPRYFKRHLLIIKGINSLPPIINRTFWQIVKKIRNRKRHCSDVSETDFKFNLIDYLERCEAIGVKKVIILKIQCPGTNMVKKNPEIIDAILAYNNILEDIANKDKFKILLIDPLVDATDEHYLEDGYHLSALGCEKVYKSLMNIFSNESKG